MVYDNSSQVHVRSGESEMKKGKIARKLSDKGFGFIRHDDGSEYFFHHSQCQTDFQELEEGDDVKFETEKSPKGPRAVNVTRIP